MRAGADGAEAAGAGLLATGDPDVPEVQGEFVPGGREVSPAAAPAAAPPEAWHSSLDLIVRSLLEILVVSVFVVTFVIEPFRIPSGSMEPTLRVGDCVLGSRQAFAPEGWAAWLLPPTAPRRGDVAVFRFPPDPGRDLVKRIVALPGDRVRMHGGHAIVNGQPVLESYARFAAGPADAFRDNFPFLRGLDPGVDPAWWDSMRQTVRDGEVTVPPGSYFVLGDNRNASEDSRYWGFVPAALLVARPLVVYLGAPAPGAATAGERLRTSFGAMRVVR